MQREQEVAIGGWGGNGGVELNTEAARHAEMKKCENQGV